MVLESEKSKVKVLASRGRPYSVIYDMAEGIACKYRAVMPAKISSYHKATLRPDNLILF